jgi:class 3 adenylate cyclase
MSLNPETRKLAAVMFADIEGYTALFQKSEKEALEQVELHRKDLQEIAETHNGSIVKFYGDGSLTLFNSVIEATQGAIALQYASRLHHIPLRIGIHMGEMIEKDDDVYGDAVNVASRIQAIGVSGSILVSKNVTDALKNHPHIQFKSLGTVPLKNVKELQEIFAIEGKGLVVPLPLKEIAKKHYYTKRYIFGALFLIAILAFVFRDVFKPKYGMLGDECIIIPPFQPHISTPKLDSIGDIAAIILSKVMHESAKVQIIPYSSQLAYTNVNVASLIDNPAKAKRLGARFMINGDYSLEKNNQSLRFWMSIMDLNTNQTLPISIPEVHCQADDWMQCIDDAANILAGYWKSNKDYFFQNTNDSAYLAFAIAQKHWADPDEKKEIKSYLLKAIHYDPKFLDAWFLLLDYFHNEADYQNGMDTLNHIKDLFPDMDQRQRDYLGYYESDYKGNYVQAFQSFLKEYKQNPKDLFVNTTGIVMAMEYLNDPKTALQLFNDLDPDSMDLSSCKYCMVRFNLALRAYLELSEVEKAGKLEEKIRPYAQKGTHFTNLMMYYMKIQDTSAVDEIIDLAVKSDQGSHADEEALRCFMAAKFAALNRDTMHRDQYATRAIQLYKKIKDSNPGRSYMLLGKWAEAEKIYSTEVKNDPTDSTAIAYLGLTYARQGKKNMAEKMIEQLSHFKTDFDYGYLPYCQARIFANLGEDDKALQYLKKAFENGIRFQPSYSFSYDPDMMVMNSNPKYLALLSKNRIDKIE